jgi:DNA-binding CsgD family transcriptional regulator
MLDVYRKQLVADGSDELALLTEREREVLQLVAEGKTSQEIADQLFVSIKTVQTHRMHIMEKLDAHDRTDLVRHAIRLGVIPSE